MHIALSDPTGDSAIFEWLDGELAIHHGKEYKVLTNSPSYDQQLAIKKYWEGVDPLKFMPGSIRGADRFACLSYYINNLPTKRNQKIITAVPEQSFKKQAALSMLSAMRSIGTPLGVSAPKKANLSSSLWRTVWNQTDQVLYFDSATTPNTFWVPFSELDFSADAEVKKLPMDDGEVYAGDASDKFVATEPFEFMPAKAN